MQVMMRAFPYEARQYQRGDGSYEPANQMAVPGNYTGPNHFIGSTGAQTWQSTGSSTANWYNGQQQGPPDTGSWERVPLQSQAGSGCSCV